MLNYIKTTEEFYAIRMQEFDMDFWYDNRRDSSEVFKELRANFPWMDYETVAQIFRDAYEESLNPLEYVVLGKSREWVSTMRLCCILSVPELKKSKFSIDLTSTELRGLIDEMILDYYLELPTTYKQWKRIIRVLGRRPEVIFESIALDLRVPTGQKSLFCDFIY